MARKKISHGLPVLPKPSLIRSKDHKTARLTEIMRGIAVAEQTEQSRGFYPVRDVARHFQLPISTVAKAYSQLEDEGLLSTLRGSKTLLQGLSAGRHFSVLGFVGMPASVSSFVALQDYRAFFVRVRRELRSRGFAVAMVLFDTADIKSGRFYKRITKYDFDTVLWYRPDASARESLSLLKDKGARVIAVSDHHLSPIQNRYEIRRETAIRQVLRYWRTKAQISSVVIVRGVKASASEEMLESLLEEEHFHFEFGNVDSKSAEKFLESLGSDQTRGLIFPSWAASMFAFREPEGLMDLAKRSHVAFIGGAPAIPFARVRDVRADLVFVDWQLIAEKIVNDLISQNAFEGREPTVFEAKTRLRASLSQYAEAL
jgi:hypothetical protein